MGTTLVTALSRHHELYLAHVGDSRAYWITRYGCYQVTLDDDVACREVRLGLSPYRVALNHPYAGSLIQALGVAASQHLYPTLSTLILDEDSLLLLCSDGLSDLDRVEQYWSTHLLPLLTAPPETDSIRHRCQALIELANTRNGHDNVTVAIIHAHIHPPDGIAPEPNYADIFYPPPAESTTDVMELEENFDPDDIPPDALPVVAAPAFSWVRVVVAAVIISILAVAVGVWAWQQGYFPFGIKNSPDPWPSPPTNSGY